ncbi:MAG: type I-A CRISPR-associated protein Cas5a [Thermoprotei archaeon]|jgi:CRISPR-associated protein Cas5a/b/c
MRGFLFDVEFMWGFQARIAGMSKTSPSYIFPPPSSILGTLAESYARRKGFSESRSVETMRRLSSDLLVLAYRPMNAIPIVFQDLNKIIAIKTAGGITYPSVKEDIYGSFDAPARGKTILSTINEKPPMLRIMLVIRENSDIITDDIWRIKRIGSKESMVSVINVIEARPEILRDHIITQYSFPLVDGIEWEREGEYVEQYFVPILGQPLTDSPSKLYLSSRAIKYIIGVPYIEYYFRIKKLPQGFVGYKIGEEVAIGIEG